MKNPFGRTETVENSESFLYLQAIGRITGKGLNMKYQYVIIQAQEDYYKVMTQQTVKRKDAVVLNMLMDSKSNLVNKYMMKIYNHLPVTNMQKWFLPLMFHRDMPSDKPVCFVFMGRYTGEVKDFLGEYLRRKYPGCKIVCRFEDIIEKMAYGNFYEYKDHFDMLLTFDELDAQKYHIPYYPSWYDECEVLDEDGIEETDVLFVGKAKDRLPEIIEAYEKLAGAGLKCKFYLVEVPEEDKVYRDQIEYGEYMPYLKVLQYVKKTKCILEILQKETESETLRVFESIFFDKKLITNNKNIQNRGYYDPQKIFCYEKIEELDPAFVNSGTDITYDDKFREQFKPYNMLNFIDNYLSEMN